MMNWTAVNCPIGEFARMVSKLKLDYEAAKEVVADKSLLEHEQLITLFRMWRIK